jgi:TPP-dependent pyruvate/acetoin dehydrogenase alpha subunit
MQRHAGIDPPEYVDWKPDRRLVTKYRRTLESDPARKALIEQLDPAQLLALYTGMVRFRVHDYTLKRWVKRGVISKAWLGTGEEAVTVGSVHALVRGSDVVAPMIRNAGALHEMGMPLDTMFAGYLGTADGPNHGVDGHFGDLHYGVLQPISHVGVMVPVVTGMAHAFALRGEPRVALTWIGDGATKNAQVHEGLNLAACWHVPAVFIIQNNQVALGTRLEQHQKGDFSLWAGAYGLAGAIADGNNVLDVWAAVRQAAEQARAGGGASLIVVETFRMGGHATHDEAEARQTFAPELFASWGKRDPIGLYEEYLVGAGISRARLEEIELQVTEEVESAAERARATRDARMPAPALAEYPGVSAGVRQPGLAARLGLAESSGND